MFLFTLALVQLKTIAIEHKRTQTIKVKHIASMALASSDTFVTKGELKAEAIVVSTYFFPNFIYFLQIETTGLNLFQEKCKWLQINFWTTVIHRMIEGFSCRCKFDKRCYSAIRWRIPRIVWYLQTISVQHWIKKLKILVSMHAMRGC